MMKNKEFSHYISKEYKLFRKIANEIKKQGFYIWKLKKFYRIEDFIYAFYKVLEDPSSNKNGYSMSEKASSIVSYMNCLIFENKYNHYYIETEELLDFLKGSGIPDKKTLIESIKKREDFILNDLGHCEIPFQIHFIGGQRSIIGFFEYSILTDDIISHAQKAGVPFDKIEYLDLSTSCGNLISYNDDYEESGFIENDIIAMNLFLYMSCFPAKITLTPPKCMIEYNGGKTCYMVGESHEVVHREGNRAHFRRGHYRLLTSERFTNKKGQIVYVSSSFVGKDKQLTVEE